MASRGSAPGNQPNIVTPPPAYGGAPPHYSDDEEDGDEDGQDGSLPSAINITIRCPVAVKGDGNVIDMDIALSANKIAHAVVNAVKGVSMNANGVPMVDEDGRPRPITVTAIADVTVTGSRNYVGDKTRQPAGAKAAPRPAQVNRDGLRVKREREGSEETEPKRSRLE